jgi:hypothetical protein
VNPRFHADVMLPDYSSEELSDFTYARVIGIYHVVVQLAGELRNRAFDFLHVRWFVRDTTATRRWRLPRIRFLDTSDPQDCRSAFGFVDPAEVIRSVHILPAFHHGSATLLHVPSLARPGEEDLAEYKLHYVGMCVYVTSAVSAL